MAYNRFYPPDLAHYEARNASPDRSHNETYDSLVITGVLGFLTYWAVFYTFFYFALNQLGLILPRHRRWLYATLLGTGLVAFILLYLQVLPLPLSPVYPLLGVVVVGRLPGFPRVRFFKTPAPEPATGVYQGLILAIFAAVLAHFIEIQFGIRHRLHPHLLLALPGLAIVDLGRLMPREGPPPLTEPGTHGGRRGYVLAAGRPPKASNDSSGGPKTKARGTAARPGGRRGSGRRRQAAGHHVRPMAAVSPGHPDLDFVVPQQQGTPLLSCLALSSTWLFASVIGSLLLRGGSVGGVEQAFQAFLIASLVTWAIVVVFAVLHPVRLPPPPATLIPASSSHFTRGP